MLVRKKNFFLRLIEGTSPEGSQNAGGSTKPEENQEPQPEPENKPESESKDDDTAAHLAEIEQLKQQLAQSQSRVEELEAKDLSELEKAQREAQKAQQRAEEAEKQLAARKRNDDLIAACKKAGLPEAMASRLQGETLEQLEQDAAALAEQIGYDRRSTDPTQGRVKTDPKPKTNGLAAALSAFYGSK